MKVALRMGSVSAEWTEIADVGMKFQHALDACWRGSLDLLFPPRCANCDADLAEGVPAPALCEECRRGLLSAAWPCCERCGAAKDIRQGTTGGCPRCRGRNLWFDQVVPLGPYQGDLRSAVLRMKRRVGDPLSYALGQAYSLIRGGAMAGTQPDLVVAVPMHWLRRLFRGTNSAEILAERIAWHLGVPLSPGLLFRSRNTLPQADLPPGRRFQNVRGAFGVRAGYDLLDRKVVLVDDILTTGATCGEIAKVLKKAGAASVVAAVLARAEGAHGGSLPSGRHGSVQ